MTGPPQNLLMASGQSTRKRSGSGALRSHGSLTRSSVGRCSRHMPKSPVQKPRLPDKIYQKARTVETGAKPTESMRLKFHTGLHTRPPLVPQLSVDARACSRGRVAVTCVVEQQDCTVLQGSSSAPERERICPSPARPMRKTASAPSTCDLAASVGDGTFGEQGLGDAEVPTDLHDPADVEEAVMYGPKQQVPPEHAYNLDELAALRDNMAELAMHVAIEQQTGSHPEVAARAQAMLDLLQRGLQVIELAEVSH